MFILIRACPTPPRREPKHVRLLSHMTRGLFDTHLIINTRYGEGEYIVVI